MCGFESRSWHHATPSERSYTEGCPSGRWCNLGKVVWGQLHRGFESPPLRHSLARRFHRNRPVDAHCQSAIDNYGHFLINYAPTDGIKTMKFNLTLARRFHRNRPVDAHCQSAIDNYGHFLINYAPTDGIKTMKFNLIAIILILAIASRGVVCYC